MVSVVSVVFLLSPQIPAGCLFFAIFYKFILFFFVQRGEMVIYRDSRKTTDFTDMTDAPRPSLPPRIQQHPQ